MLNFDSTHLNFIKTLEGGGLTPAQIVIIESNVGTQINVKVGYTNISWNAETPARPILVEKYETSSMLNKLYTITLTWNGSLLDNVVIVNEDDDIEETITLTFVNGLLTEVEKT